MSGIKICNRCGRANDGQSQWTTLETVGGPAGTIGRKFDICTDCFVIVFDDFSKGEVKFKNALKSAKFTLGEPRPAFPQEEAESA